MLYQRFVCKKYDFFSDKRLKKNKTFKNNIKNALL